MPCCSTQLCHLTPSFRLPELRRQVNTSVQSQPASSRSPLSIREAAPSRAGPPSGRCPAGSSQPLLPQHLPRAKMPNHPWALPDIAARGWSWCHQPALVRRPGCCWSPARSLRISEQESHLSCCSAIADVAWVIVLVESHPAENLCWSSPAQV